MTDSGTDLPLTGSCVSSSSADSSSSNSDSVEENKDERHKFNNLEGSCTFNLDNPTLHPSLSEKIYDNGNGNSDEDVDDEIQDQQSCSQSTTSSIYHSKLESQTVVRLKLIVITILVVSAVAVGVGTFVYLQNSEQSKFHDTYQDDATKVASSIYGGVINTFAALDVLSTVALSAADAANATFPLTTIPHFANHAAKSLSMSAGFLVSFTVIVHNRTERLIWEKYAWDHRSIVNETLHIMETDPNYVGSIPWNVTRKKSLHGDYDIVPYNESRLFAPIWQIYPIPVEGFAAFNYDWFSVTNYEYFIQMFKQKRGVIGEPYILPDPTVPDEVAEAEYWARIYAGSITPGDDPLEPVSDILYPIMNDLDRIQLITSETDDKNDELNSNHTTTKNDTRNEIVAVMGASFYWRDVMKNTLPSGKRGLIVVIENPCTVSFTYQINGPQAQYLGRGDVHSNKYDSMKIQKTFFELDQYSTVTSEYTGIPLSKEFCPFTATFYPSQDMEDQFTSNDPIIFASIAVFIFIFTSIVFIIYDMKVEHRQKVVASTAARSNAVLSSLFPANVRKKLLNENPSNGSGTIDPFQSKKQSNHGSTNNPVDNLRAFLQKNNNRRQTDTNPSVDTLSPQNMFGELSTPIADLYSDTTVFFADICGFTSWSSSRGPDQVFLLLESLYREFDQVARRKRVFKVETIGDSYVAVAGLPDPMKHHATTMVQFAEEILSILGKITKAISSTLGPDTANLNMRIGLNSGPTTAGVIRGEKSRFQLFGDTVNTASRMESTGQPGKIQCTIKTADLLREAGKDHWLTKRNGTVNVKGKGAMETYWVKTSVKTSVTTSVKTLSSSLSRRRTIDFMSRSNHNN